MKLPLWLTRNRFLCFLGLHDWQNFGETTIGTYSAPYKYTALIQRCRCNDCWATRFL